MKIPVNKEKQGQCPTCEKWNDLELDVHGLLYGFTCCRRNFVIAIDSENLEKLSKGKKIKKLPDDWMFR